MIKDLKQDADKAVFRQFSGAPYNYFRITNFREAKNDFLSGRASQPIFTHTNRLKQIHLVERKHQLIQAKAQLSSQEAKEFISKRIIETNLMLAFLALNKQPNDSDLLKHYRHLVVRNYGDFQQSTVSEIYHYLEERAITTKTTRLLKDLRRTIQIDASASQLYKPTPDTFYYYRGLAADSDHPISLLIDKYPLNRESDLVKLLGWALDTIGALDDGWRIIPTNSARNVAVLKLKKKILVSRNREASSLLRSRQVTAHEVFVHVRRSMLHDNHQSFATEEGVGVLAEQLIDNKFRHKRIIRYLAAALAWGADGEPRDFAQTFTVIYRVVRIINGCDEGVARERAFAECARVFRGGIPSLAGAAFIKDKIYLEANLSVWQDLENNKISRQKFVDFLDGREFI